MPRPKKKVEAKSSKAKPNLPKQPDPVSVQLEQERLQEIETLRFIELIEIVRTTKNPKIENTAFIEIFEKLKPRIQKMISSFTIPGLNSDDIMQEALVALRTKAIKDYDRERGSGEGPAAFDRFAMICIRRHLSTELKSSLQNNRKKILNKSVSLDQDSRGGFDDDSLSLASIVPSIDGDILDTMQDREYFRNLMTNLVKHLSKFEKEVLALYAQRLSYEEITDKINEKRVKIKVNVKGIDNALSRIKKKAKIIIAEYETINSTDVDGVRRIKRKELDTDEHDDIDEQMED